MRSALPIARVRRVAVSALGSSVLLAILTTASAGAQVQPVGATAEVRDVAGRQVATAEFREGRGEVLVTIIFSNPPALTGTHGLRLHEVGRCDPPNFTSAGNGFNPTNKQHGRQNPDGPQVGDLPNVNFTTGLTSYNTSAMGATLAPGPNSLLGPNRTALIIYAGEDDQTTDPDGKAGARIACGVVLPTAAGAAAQPQAPIAGQPAPPVSPAVPKPVASPSPVQVPGQAVVPVQPAPGQPAQGQPQFPQQLPASPKPVASPSTFVPPPPQVIQPPVVAKPTTSPVVAVASPAASPVVPPAVIAVPTAPPSASGQTASSGSQNLGTVPALIIAILGVGLVGGGYLLRRRNQMR